ncbi:ATPase, F1/V1/A1 complex, alpha/beta subunit, Zinc knuckle CX2CX4HX4C [Artemisia annua]|uniref:ATPase, F1/V1/A1 complex, alpha/beta subunit, Zinc knuckle CX2CX4HX4C n=1 Tax=Artemisia annua TaxID=35608 RepID=A0A2U1QMW3_ARTAN|nr:ATPase, F1/V1/A1 complex, alpha/beta subunit, Zinc knuckle CX2CX4HX4C [Artemisia annua]
MDDSRVSESRDKVNSVMKEKGNEVNGGIQNPDAEIVVSVQSTCVDKGDSVQTCTVSETANITPCDMNTSVGVEQVSDVDKDVVIQPNNVSVSASQNMNDCVETSNKTNPNEAPNKKTYASATKNSGIYETNKLLFIPPALNELGSSVGKPIIMDSMTAYVCKNGVGRTEYARILVEIDAIKGLKETVELQYRDMNKNVKGTKTVKVAYDWKPPICTHCKVFGHDFKGCTIRGRTVEEEKAELEKTVNGAKENEFVQKPATKPNVSGTMNTQGPNRGGFNKQQNLDKNKSTYGLPRQQWNKKVTSTENKEASENKNDNFDKDFPIFSGANTKKDKNNKGKQTSVQNSFSVLKDLGEDNVQEINMLKDKSIVDKYLNMRMKPSNNVLKTWSQEMKKYFNRAWEADREKEKDDREKGMEDINEEVFEDESIAAKNLVADELVGTSTDEDVGKKEKMKKKKHVAGKAAERQNKKTVESGDEKKKKKRKHAEADEAETEIQSKKKDKKKKKTKE